MSEPIVAQFVAALNGMSSRDLYQLATVLRDAEKREAALQVIAGLARLKSSSSDLKVNAKSEAVQAVGGGDQPELPNTNDDIESLREGLYAFLGDRAAFQSNEDVIDIINECFGFKWKYSDLKREGRDRIISRVWTRLSMLPKREQEKKLRSFCDRHRQFESVDAYKELFKILSRGE